MLRIALATVSDAQGRLTLRSRARTGRRARVEVRLRNSDGHVSRLLSVRRRATSYQRDREPSLCGRERQRA